MAEILDKDSLKALSTETRQEIIKMLSKRPYTASEISKIMNKHVTTITEHLEILEKAGLINRKDSTNKWVYYTLTDKGTKLFKPMYYTWVITLSIALVVVVTASLWYAFSPTGQTALSVAQESKGQDLLNIAPAASPVSVSVGKLFEENGSSYMPLMITEQGSNERVPVEVEGKLHDSGSVPVYISDTTDNVEIVVHRAIIRNDERIIPIEITQKEKSPSAPVTTGTSSTAEEVERTVRIRIIDESGNVNTFPLNMPRKSTVATID